MANIYRISHDVEAAFGELQRSVQNYTGMKDKGLSPQVCAVLEAAQAFAWLAERDCCGLYSHVETKISEHEPCHKKSAKDFVADKREHLRLAAKCPGVRDD